MKPNLDLKKITIVEQRAARAAKEFYKKNGDFKLILTEFKQGPTKQVPFEDFNETQYEYYYHFYRKCLFKTLYVEHKSALGAALIAEPTLLDLIQSEKNDAKNDVDGPQDSEINDNLTAVQRNTIQNLAFASANRFCSTTNSDHVFSAFLLSRSVMSGILHYKTNTEKNQYAACYKQRVIEYFEKHPPTPFGNIDPKSLVYRFSWSDTLRNPDTYNPKSNKYAKKLKSDSRNERLPVNNNSAEAAPSEENKMPDVIEILDENSLIGKTLERLKALQRQKDKGPQKKATILPPFSVVSMKTIPPLVFSENYKQKCNLMEIERTRNFDTKLFKPNPFGTRPKQR